MSTDRSQHHLHPEPREEGDARHIADIGYIAERVNAARIRRGTAQEDLATAIGRTRRWVYDLEHGRLSRIRAIEQGARPLPHDLENLQALAQELCLDLVPTAALMPEEPVLAPAALAALAITPPPPLTLAPEVDMPAPVEPPPSPVLGRVVALPVPSPAPSAPRRRAEHGGSLRLTSLCIAGAAVLGTAVLAAASTGALALPTLGAPHTTARLATTPVPPALLHVAVQRPHPATVAPIAAPPVPAPALAVVPPEAVPPATVPTLTAAHVVPAARAVAGPIASLSASSIDFGWVAVGSTATRTVTLTNTGDRALHVSQTTLFGGSELSTPQDSCNGRTLSPGQRCSVTLTYRPLKAGMLTYVAQLGFVDDAPGVGGGQVVKLDGSTR